MLQVLAAQSEEREQIKEPEQGLIDVGLPDALAVDIEDQDILPVEFFDCKLFRAQVSCARV